LGQVKTRPHYYAVCYIRKIDTTSSRSDLYVFSGNWALCIKQSNVFVFPTCLPDVAEL